MYDFSNGLFSQMYRITLFTSLQRNLLLYNSFTGTVDITKSFSIKTFVDQQNPNLTDRESLPLFPDK